DGKIIAASSRADAKVHVWEVATGKELSQLGTDQHWYFDVAISPDGRLLASLAAETNSVHLWNLQTGKEVGKLGSKGHTIAAFAWSRDGRTIVTGGYDQIPSEKKSRERDPFGRIEVETPRQVYSLRLWEVASGQERQRLTWDRNLEIERLHFLRDGRQLAVIGRFGPVRLYDPAEGKVIREFAAGVDEITISADERFVAGVTDRNDPWVATWDLATGKERRRWRGSANGLAFSPDGKTLAAIR